MTGLQARTRDTADGDPSLRAPCSGAMWKIFSPQNGLSAQLYFPAPARLKTAAPVSFITLFGVLLITQSGVRLNATEITAVTARAADAVYSGDLQGRSDRMEAPGSLSNDY